jgi:ADP-heptose:LPS heptosyltransferase
VTHLAAALGVPTVAVFGPTDPARWAPRGRGRVKIVRAPDGDLAKLAVADVLEAVNVVTSH